ncbi:unnamed protein product, partial [Iphiclides podalirius]
MDEHTWTSRSKSSSNRRTDELDLPRITLAGTFARNRSGIAHETEEWQKEKEAFAQHSAYSCPGSQNRNTVLIFVDDLRVDPSVTERINKQTKERDRSKPAEKLVFASSKRFSRRGIGLCRI